MTTYFSTIREIVLSKASKDAEGYIKTFGNFIEIDGVYYSNLNF